MQSTGQTSTHESVLDTNAGLSNYEGHGLRLRGVDYSRDPARLDEDEGAPRKKELAQGRGGVRRIGSAHASLALQQVSVICSSFLPVMFWTAAHRRHQSGREQRAHHMPAHAATASRDASASMPAPHGEDWPVGLSSDRCSRGAAHWAASEDWLMRWSAS